MFSITLGSKFAKFYFLKKISVLSAIIYRIEVHVIINPSSRLEKHQTLEFSPMTEMLRFIKKTSFSAFSDMFENHQLHILKSLCVFCSCDHI